MVTEQAPAKINLFLHVGDKRADGFHPLQSLAVFTDLGDALAVEVASSLSLTLEGPFAKGLEAENDNLVLRAARVNWRRAKRADQSGSGAIGPGGRHKSPNAITVPRAVGSAMRSCWTVDLDGVNSSSRIRETP